MHPQTGYFFDAQLLLGEATLACGDADTAAAALGEVFRLDRDADRRRQANFLLAQVQAAQGRMDAAYASYLRLALHPDPTRDPDTAPLYRRSTLEALTLAGNAGDWETVVVLAEKFLVAWPNDPDGTAVRQKRNRARVELSRAGADPGGAPGPETAE
jgi:TolA-binding protein